MTFMLINITSWSFQNTVYIQLLAEMGNQTTHENASGPAFVFHVLQLTESHLTDVC
jgi:hypothetical protein